MEVKHVFSFENSSLKGLICTIYGVIAAVISLLVFSFIGSGVVYFTNIPESIYSSMAIIINILGMFIGGFIAAYFGKNKGLVRGLVVAVIVLLLMLIIAKTPLAQIPIKALYTLLAGALGGVFGIR